MATKRIQNLFKSVNDRIQSLLEFDRFYAALYDPVRSLIEFPWVVDGGKSEEWSTRPYQGAAWLLDTIIHTKAPRLLESDLKQALERDGIKYWPDGGLPQSWLAAPMIAEDRVIGVLVVENRRKSKAFGENGVRVFTTVARQAAVAIENARLVDQRDRKIASLRALYEMGQQLNSDIRSDEPAILQLIYKQATRLMDTRNLYIALYDETTDTVSFPLMFVDGMTTQVESRTGGKGRTEWIIHNRQPIFIETRVKSEAWYDQPGRREYIKQPFASWVGVPMMVGNKVLGVIATYHKILDYVYTKDDQEVLSLMANQAAVAIENARLHRDLERRAEALQEANRALEGANRQIADREAILVRTLIAEDFVHRLNNLAGTIPIWVSLIREEIDRPDPRKEELTNYLSQIEMDTNGLLRAAEQLRHPPSNQKVDVAFVLQSMLRQVRIQYPDRIETSSEIEPKLYRVLAVPSSLTSALWNVISNGVEALLLEDKGTLTVNVRNCLGEFGSKYVQITVADTGKGVPEEDRDKIFTPFFTTKEVGRGYGLWRAKTIIENLGGKISVESQTGNGAIFTIQLPGISQEE